MVKNYFKAAFRNIKKNKLNAVINIAGLSAGLACCLITLMYVDFEKSYDNFHENASRIFRVTAVLNKHTRPDPYAKTPAPMAGTLKAEIPAVVKAVTVSTRVPNGSGLLVSSEGRELWEDDFLLAGKDFFDVFSFTFIAGDRNRALEDPSGVIIDEKTAQKYFGSHNPVGDVLHFRSLGGKNKDFYVSGVIQDVPENSQLQFSILFPFSEQQHNLEWGSWNYYTYVELAEGADPGPVEKKLPGIMKKYMNQQAYESTELSLQPLLSIHLNSNLRNDFPSNRNVSLFYYLLSVSILILIVAVLNYMNLVSAGSAVRGKEVSMRKVAGASKRQLLVQFLFESTLLAILAYVLAFASAFAFLPLFKNLLDTNLVIMPGRQYQIYVVLFLVSLLTGVISGCYPAAVLSSFDPVRLLKGGSGPGRVQRGRALNYLFIGFQFFVSTLMIICAVTVKSQLDHIRHESLNSGSDNIIVIPVFDLTEPEKMDIVKPELLKYSNIEQVTFTSYLQSETGYNQSVWWQDLEGNENEMMRWMPVGPDFADMMGLEIVAGRDFSNRKSDVEKAYLLNEEAVRHIGWKNPLEKDFKIVHTGKVIGIVKDFHFRSFHHNIEPLALCVYPRLFKYMYVKVNPLSLKESLTFMETRWKELFPARPFRYSFFSDDFERVYLNETKLGKAFNAVSGLTLLIACFGLFGMVSFTAERRKKEIGIRKTLGADAGDMMRLIMKEYVYVIFSALIIAIPAGIYIMRMWLERFAYTMYAGPWIYFAAVSALMMLTFLTVMYRVIRAASANPVESIRYE